jgi:serine/threonine protein kinase
MDQASSFRECDSDLSLIDHALAQTARSREILARADALPEPSSFPGYTIHREVRRGGQGVVYEATQQATGRRIAIKVIRDGSLAGGSELTRFRREIAILAQFTHPNIV